MDVVVEIMRNIWLQALFSLIMGYFLNVNNSYQDRYELIHNWLMKVMYVFLSLCATVDFPKIYIIMILFLISLSIVSLVRKYISSSYFKRDVKKCF